MGNGATQKCRLLLEGREVPFISATIISNIGEPLVAMIDLVPLKVIKFIRPKTQVQLFVQDSFNFRDLNFYCAFEGEVVGRTMLKRDGARAFQITTVDYSGYWDEAKAYYYNPNFLVGKMEDTITGGLNPEQEAQFSGATKLTSASNINSVMIDLITRAMRKDATTDMIDGVVNVVRALTQINLFYKAAFSRLRFTDRIRVFSGSNVKGFLQFLKMDEFLLSYTGKQGGMTSLRDMLLNVMALVFHDFISVPFPSFVDFKQNGKLVGKTIGNFLFVPDGYTLPPPKYNVIFPNQIQSFEFRDDFRAAPTRFAFRASFPGFATELAGIKTYPIQFYPTSVRDYMFGRDDETDAELSSLLGTSTILKEAGSGSDKRRTYLDFVNEGGKYGFNVENKKDKAVGGVSVSPILREADFLTNEESIKGIFLELETFIPGMTTLVAHNPAKSVTSFTRSIGTYLFFKKRFAARNASAQLLFHPFLVPGFNSLIIDDSEAGQTFIAKVQQVVHNLTHQGCSTTVQLGYARDFDEVDALTGGSGEPPLPQWFDPNKFGSVDKDKTVFKNETNYLIRLGLLGPQATNGALGIEELLARQQMANSNADITVFTHMSSFYQLLLGTDSVTDNDAQLNAQTTPDLSSLNVSQIATSRGAAFFLTEQFKKVSSDPIARDSFVANYIRRPVPTMAETMTFVGAKPAGTNNVIPNEFAVFEAVTTGTQAGRFDGTHFEDEDILKVRRQVIDIYVDLLKNARGFRG